jgi:hypothetical protein
MQSAGIGIVVAIVAVIITYFIGDAVSGPLRALGPDGEMADVPLAGGIIGTVLGGLVGTLIAFLLRNRGNGVNIFLGICAVALVLYGLYAISAADTLTTGIWLNVMHIAAAVPIVGSLMQWMNSRVPATGQAVAA